MTECSPHEVGRLVGVTKWLKPVIYFQEILKMNNNRRLDYLLPCRN
jgi:hypothetical protein